MVADRGVATFSAGTRGSSYMLLLSADPAWRFSRGYQHCLLGIFETRRVTQPLRGCVEGALFGASRL